MRDDFADIVSGWTLIDGMDDLTDRIERAARWTLENGPLLPRERATIDLMIQSQIARGMDIDPWSMKALRQQKLA
jgi:hypothetical protein